MTARPTNASAGKMASRAYADIGLQTQVLGASPQHLITLLFDGAQAAILKARLHMRQGNIEGRGLAISRAIDIVDSGLKTSVDREAGGELAANLLTVYELVIRNLMLANLNNDAARLDLAERLLTDIGDAWRTSTGTGSSTGIGT